ncbi:hypothetical protein A8E62_31915 [Burkholderia cenocepacia]|uniref:Uncharacterized protein n=1 Tax=Burkholderia cenocepacia TaxID=95486 RepID=A0A1V2VU35_9BURK|nr:hypothetical protein A8E62_31915 [Burkholderia cenocepacia]ONU51162.1 hypothetical protein A8E67_35485 [Burkholderia cenocepacia]ONU66306.1 hypothetical protein A8E68_07470 [Burkholderia cenocepacia]ONU71093.1 hypothetical protein A8E63_40950 [Burkholderia cenocepacia]ONU76354.1 hypothetical protein A8E72_34135 [Burkholderia cenocepacia]
MNFKIAISIGFKSFHIEVSAILGFSLTNEFICYSPEIQPCGIGYSNFANFLLVVCMVEATQEVDLKLTMKSLGVQIGYFVD